MSTEVKQLLELDEPLTKLVQSVRNGEPERIALESDGKIVAAIVSRHDLERLEDFDQKRNAAIRAIELIRKQFEDVPEDEIERETEKAIREAREDMDRDRRAAIAALRVSAPELTEDELVDTAMAAVRRADIRESRERLIAAEALKEVRGTAQNPNPFDEAERAVLAVRRRPSSSAAAK